MSDTLTPPPVRDAEVRRHPADGNPPATARDAAPATSRATLGPPDAATLQALMASALRHIDVERVGAGAGSVADVAIGRIALDEVAVEEVRIDGLATRVSCGSAVLRDVRAIVELNFTAHWRYDLKWLGEDAGVKVLGSKSSTVELHDIRLPMLEDFEFVVPEARVEDVRASIDPVEALSLGAAELKGLRIDGTRAPTEGFALEGLDLGSLEITRVAVPATATRAVTIDEFAPEAPLVLPRVALQGIELPAVGIEDAASNGAVSVIGAAFEAVEAPAFKLGDLFEVKVVVEPVLHLQIGELVLADLEASATIESVAAGNVSTRVRASDVALDALALRDIEIPGVVA